MPRTLLCLAVLVSVLGLPGLARSEEPEAATPASERWIPSVTGIFQLFSYEADGRVDTSLGFPDSGSSDGRVPTFQIGLDLMSPALEDVPTAPHFVGFAGLQAGPPRKLGLADAGELASGQPEKEIARLEAMPPNTYPAPEALPGQGSELTGRYRALGWYLGMGMAFDIPKAEPSFRIRPYVTAVGEQVKVKGQVVRVTGQPPGQPYMVDRVSASVKEFFYYVGPGVQLEVIVEETPTWALSLFATADFLWNVGDDSLTFSARQAIFHYKADSFQPRGGFGVRWSWVGALP